jgi:RNA polymerase primary sigma factor
MRQLKISKQITNREHASLDKYLQEVGREPLISSDEEVILAQRIRQGDMTALEKLTKANLRFVISVAKQYQNQGLPLQDLINEGNMGLIRAAEKFDETRGFKFISYAVWWIRQSILQALAEQARIVRLPLNKIGTLNKINKAYSLLEQELERPPTPDELSEYLEMNVDDIKKALTHSARHSSIDAPVNDNDDSSASMIDFMANTDFPSPDSEMLKQSLKREIERSLSTLSQRERCIIRMFYGLDGAMPISLDEIGAKFDLTRERVRQIKEKAIRRLKHTSRCRHLKLYLG